MTPGRHDDPSELRELAEDAIDRSDRWHLGRGDGIEQSQATALARGLLSALDALEAANKERDEAMDAVGLPRTATLEGLIRHHRANAELAASFKTVAAEASRDQAIKERDEHTGRLEAIRAIATHNAERHTGFVHIGRICALAGVPGGSPEEHPEEHNPGGTAVAVPGSKSEEA